MWIRPEQTRLKDAQLTFQFQTEQVSFGHICSELEEFVLRTGSIVGDPEHVSELDVCVIKLQLLLRTWILFWCYWNLLMKWIPFELHPKYSLCRNLFLPNENYLILELDFDIVVKFGDRTSALRPTSTSELKWQVDRVKGDIAPLWEAKYHRHPQGFLPKDRRHTAFIHITNLQIVRGITGIGQKVGPRLRESCLLAPSGCGGRVHAT